MTLFLLLGGASLALFLPLRRRPHFWQRVLLCLAVALVPKDLAFLAAKGCSIVVPFFGLYFLRKFLYYLVKRRRSR